MGWFPRKNVVVPVDFSDYSFGCLEVATEFVENLSDIHVVHVLPKLSPMEPGVIWGTVDDESRKQHVIEELMKRLTKEQAESVSIEVLIGQPEREIAGYAQEVGADLIVIHSHGKTGPTQMLIGSTTERVVRQVHCPVLVLRD